jgi:hypothetical protein
MPGNTPRFEQYVNFCYAIIIASWGVRGQGSGILDFGFWILDWGLHDWRLKPPLYNQSPPTQTELLA